METRWHHRLPWPCGSPGKPESESIGLSLKLNLNAQVNPYGWGGFWLRLRQLCNRAVRAGPYAPAQLPPTAACTLHDPLSRQRSMVCAWSWERSTQCWPQLLVSANAVHLPCAVINLADWHWLAAHDCLKRQLCHRLAANNCLLRQLCHYLQLPAPPRCAGVVNGVTVTQAIGKDDRKRLVAYVAPAGVDPAAVQAHCRQGPGPKERNFIVSRLCTPFPSCCHVHGGVKTPRQQYRPSSLLTSKMHWLLASAQSIAWHTCNTCCAHPIAQQP